MALRLIQRPHFVALVWIDLVKATGPASIKELEEMTGRKSSSLSRTLKTMERYGIVSLTKVKNKVKPEVNATEFQIEFGLNKHSA